MGQEHAPPTFPSLDDLLDQVRDLAQEHADRVRFTTFGRSRRGEDLFALRLGDGPLRALAYGFPQPDEPLGGVSLLHLARLVLAEEGLYHAFSWTLIPCVDPDGARMNEGWFTAPLDLRTYARRHFRPPEGEQVEWTFPSNDPAWRWDRPLPETRALQELLEQTRPQVLLPLHNALIGGAYAFVSPGADVLALALPALWRGLGLPTHLGEPELPFAPAMASGVYRLPVLGEIAAALRGHGVDDPADLFRCGAPAYVYARRFDQPLTVVPELPLFTVAGIDDTQSAGFPRRRALSKAWEREREIFATWSELHRQAGLFLQRDTPYRRALEAHQRCAPILMEASARWLESDPALGRPATLAEVVDCQHIHPYMQLLPLGTLWQALEYEAGRGGASAEHLALQELVARCLEEELAVILAGLDARPVSVQLLVDIVEQIVRVIHRGVSVGGAVEP